MNKLKKDITIGYPCYDGRCEFQAAQNIFMAMGSANSRVANVKYLPGDSLVSRARNKITAAFLSGDTEYLLFIDSDILFNVAHIERLREWDKGVIGGVYFKKKIPYEAVANSHNSTDDDGLYLMNEIGTGFMMIRRDVFDAIREKFPEKAYKKEGDEQDLDAGYFDYFPVGVHNGRYLSEDYYFCQMARDCGYNIYYDTSIIVSHRGSATYPFKDNDMFETSADILHKYHTNAPLSKEMLDKIQAGLNHQRTARGYE